MALNRQKLTDLYGHAFAVALNRTLGFEGGWSDHPNDRGGLTYMGITSRTLSRYNSVTGHDLYMEHLTPETVADIYHELFWLVPNIGMITGVELPGFMFDFYVHSGPRAVRFLQSEVGAKEDGILGPKTIASLPAWPYHDLIKSLAMRRMKFLCRIVQNNPSQAAFIVGWFNRVSTWL